ncbi:MAG TPA: hypothetical protein VGE07_01810 [Herpetosiphonaceae bacterium]
MTGNEVWGAIANGGIALEVMDDSWGYRHRYGVGGPYGSREAALQAALADLFDRLAALAAVADHVPAAPAPDGGNPLGAAQPDRIEQAINDASDLA